ncbi:MAG TPA: HlyD family efflux transporter periplasmic adaptor subunit [Bacteroidia bacterium]|jgi:multidrug efflux pump subunit AcrA (membrane-fusion protein)|nr:HlyD family efflux transporter periplasmic adaptor subunit [Bacteroidia bacterium]
MNKLVFFPLLLCSLAFFSCGRKTSSTKPERRDVTETVFASGTLEPENKYSLTAQSDGYIIELNFDDGDTVKKDQVLAVIDNKANTINAGSAENILGLVAKNASAEGPTLKQAEQNTRLLGEKYRQDSLQYVRYQKLAQSNSVSTLELENMKLAFESSKINYINALQNYRLLKQQTEQQLILQKSMSDVNEVMNDNNRVKAVVGGRIYKRMKQNGDYVRKGDIIATIGSAEFLYAKLSIDETNISKLKLGQNVIIQLNTNKTKNYSAKISEIYPSFEEQTQSFYCKALFTENLDFKISGTQLQANIIIAEKKNALVIPKNYLGFDNKVRVEGKGEVTVVPGFVSNDWVEILSGLDENTIITTENIK